MEKTAEFSRVLDLLSNAEKDRLLTSAKGLMKAQKAVRLIPAEKPLSKNKNQEDDNNSCMAKLQGSKTVLADTGSYPEKF